MRLRRRWRTAACALGWAVSAAACSLAEPIDEFDCPPEGTTLTYENFGAPFLETWCVRCHGGTNSVSSRAFTTFEAVDVQRDRIFANSAGDNVAMPPGPDDPPPEERAKLAEWLACSDR